MKVQAKFYGFAGAPDRPATVLSLELPDGATVADVIARAGVSADQVELITVNGNFTPASTGLKDGDVVALSGPDDIASVGG